MSYSTINGLFFFLSITATFLVLSHYHSRRENRLSTTKGTGSHAPVWQNRGKTLIFIPVSIVYLLSALLVDNHFDSFRQTYDVPARTMDVALLHGFATIGLMVTFVTAFIGLVEMFDWLRFRQQDL